MLKMPMSTSRKA